ncbi:MAG: ABC transporter permease [Gemmataceae bacterium]|nr:ABC transporter permease [Gemmataceae bacterium]
MSGYLGVAATGLVAVRQYPLRSAATVGCLVAVLFPLVAGLGLSRGVQEQARESARHGADLTVTGEQFGREVPVPVAAADRIRRVDGVREVVPRIVARIALGKDREEAVLVGMPVDRFPAEVTCVEGRLPAPGAANELVVGTELAARLGLRVGSVIPPFYHNDRGERLSRVVGLFRSDAPLWQARLILTPFETAEAVCNQHGLATQFLVYCRPGAEADVKAAVLRGRATPPGEGDAPVGFRVTSREELLDLLPAGLRRREGVFNLTFLVALAAGVLAVVVTSGVGSPGRRREVGILKATGWQTDEVLLRGLVESVFLGLIGAAVAVLLAYAWLRLGNGYWVAGLFLAGVGVRPTVRVPFDLTPGPVLTAFALAQALVLVGSVWATWRAAVAPPREAMR